MTHKYTINGMTCNSCVGRVKSELLKLSDVLEADVQLQSPQAVITMNKHIPTDRLQKAIANAGRYTIAEADGGMSHHAATTDTTGEEKASYYPIYLIFGYITLVTLLIQFISGDFDWQQWMSHFMAGFFLVFSFFKLLNIRGFAEGYSTYDIVAKTVPAWGFIYPFIELSLGLLLLTGVWPQGTNIVTFIVMGVSTIGVAQSLLRKKPFQCACLGTVIKVPLSKVTFFEDALMVLMSGIMIVTMLLN
jgi:cation transport ATPase